MGVSRGKVMKTYKTSEVAKAIGIHSNTLRLYEELKLIPKPIRQANGYRVFTDFHIQQLKLARLGLQLEVLQNGLRKKIIQVIKVSATKDFDTAIALTTEYLVQVHQETANAEEAIVIVQQIILEKDSETTICFKRKEVSKYLNISIDVIRNWEMNGLLKVKRKENGYRIYTNEEIRLLKIIRSLRCANYSLESILQLLLQLSQNPKLNIKEVLNKPKENAEIISACDKLILSLSLAESNALKIMDMLQKMKQNL